MLTIDCETETFLKGRASQDSQNDTGKVLISTDITYTICNSFRDASPELEPLNTTERLGCRYVCLSKGPRKSEKVDE